MSLPLPKNSQGHTPCANFPHVFFHINTELYKNTKILLLNQAKEIKVMRRAIAKWLFLRAVGKRYVLESNTYVLREKSCTKFLRKISFSLWDQSNPPILTRKWPFGTNFASNYFLLNVISNTNPTWQILDSSIEFFLTVHFHCPSNPKGISLMFKRLSPEH